MNNMQYGIGVLLLAPFLHELALKGSLPMLQNKRGHVYGLPF